MSSTTETHTSVPSQQRMEDSEKQSSSDTPAPEFNWDHADENPRNWPRWKQAYHVFVPALLGFVS